MEEWKWNEQMGCGVASRPKRRNDMEKVRYWIEDKYMICIVSLCRSNIFSLTFFVGLREHTISECTFGVFIVPATCTVTALKTALRTCRRDVIYFQTG
jgi:hypothetical protein